MPNAAAQKSPECHHLSRFRVGGGLAHPETRKQIIFLKTSTKQEQTLFPILCKSCKAGIPAFVFLAGRFFQHNRAKDSYRLRKASGQHRFADGLREPSCFGDERMLAKSASARPSSSRFRKLEEHIQADKAFKSET